TQRFIDNITSITPGALKGGLMTVARHPTKDELLCGGADGVPKIYKMYRTKKRVIGDDFNLLQTFPPLPGRIFAARYNRDGTHIVVGSSLDGRGEVRVYQASTGPHPNLLALCVLPVFSHAAIAPLLFTDDLRTDRQVCTLAGQRGAVYAVAYRPDSKVVASAGFDGLVRLNDAATGQLIKEFRPVPLRPATLAGGARGQGIGINSVQR
ncbi:MAG TPA: hypothetical protein VFA18_13630, partial [Gemmataceae bacterium]|nr:hypothetical protein [Gemmataceae bacterium]